MQSEGHESMNLDLCDVKTIISSILRGILNAVTALTALRPVTQIFQVRLVLLGVPPPSTDP